MGTGGAIRRKIAPIESASCAIEAHETHSWEEGLRDKQVAESTQSRVENGTG